MKTGQIAEGSGNKPKALAAYKGACTQGIEKGCKRVKILGAELEAK